MLRTADPGFEFTDPPLRGSLPVNLAFAATADRPTAVLTGPSHIAGSQPGLIRLPRALVSHEMALVGLQDHPLTATAALIWNGDLPRPLQQILFDAADGIAPPDPARPPATHARAQVPLRRSTRNYLPPRAPQASDADGLRPTLK